MHFFPETDYGKVPGIKFPNAVKNESGDFLDFFSVNFHFFVVNFALKSPENAKSPDHKK